MVGRGVGIDSTPLSFPLGRQTKGIDTWPRIMLELEFHHKMEGTPKCV